jgi:hypothetical protein
MDRSQAQVTDPQHVAVLHAQIRKWRRAVAMHHDRDAERFAQLVRRREMVGVGMSVDDVSQSESVASDPAPVPVDQSYLRIDEDGGAGFLAADEIGLAPTLRELLENHRAPPS